jgi:hypothetical protein
MWFSFVIAGITLPPAGPGRQLSLPHRQEDIRRRGRAGPAAAAAKLDADRQPCHYSAVVPTDDAEWLALLRDLDQPLPPRAPMPPIESFMNPVSGSPGVVRFDEAAAVAAIRERPVRWPDGWEVPLDFDEEALRARIGRLAERLGEVYGVPLAVTRGAQHAAYFGGVVVPGEQTATRAERTRFPLTIMVSNFGGLVTIWVMPDPSGGGAPPPPVHPHDLERIEPVATGLGFAVVPEHLLALPYDGPNATPSHTVTWWERYFGYP